MDIKFISKITIPSPLVINNKMIEFWWFDYNSYIKLAEECSNKLYRGLAKDKLKNIKYLIDEMIEYIGFMEEEEVRKQLIKKIERESKND